MVPGVRSRAVREARSKTPSAVLRGLSRQPPPRLTSQKKRCRWPHETQGKQPGSPSPLPPSDLSRHVSRLMDRAFLHRALSSSLTPLDDVWNVPAAHVQEDILERAGLRTSSTFDLTAVGLPDAEVKGRENRFSTCFVSG